MNAKLARQVEEMKKQTIGVEVEMNSIARSRAAKVAADFFGTGRHEYTARRNGYETYSASARRMFRSKEEALAQRQENKDAGGNSDERNR